MSEFSETALSFLVFASRPITYGIVQPGPDISPDGVPLIRGKDYSSGKVDTSYLYHVLPEIDRPYARSKVEAGDLLLSIVGYVGQVAQVPAELSGANITQTTARISVDPAKADSKFLFHYLSAPHFRSEITRYEKGSAQPGLNLSDVARLRVKRPALPQQRRIAEILSTVDEAIEQTEALIAKYQQIKAGLMHDLFTRGVTPDGHLRPTYKQAPQLYKESSLGWIPKEWELRSCSDVCVSVIDCKNRTPPITAEGHPVIRTPNVRDGEFVWGDLNYTDEKSYLVWTARGKPQSGDIVITREAPVGEVCMIPADLHAPCLGQRMMLYRPDLDLIRPTFMLHALQSPRVQKYLDIISGGSTVGHVRVGEIRSLNIPYPALSEQQIIADALQVSRYNLDEAFRSISKLRQQKQGLMQDLLTGRVRVKVGESEAKA